MIKGALEPGVEVGCEYRWPYCANHPDCWKPPHKGIVLALDDPRAWKDSLAFPGLSYPDGPCQQLVTPHVEDCVAKGLLADKTPVLWQWFDEPQPVVMWDTKLRPYAEELAAWEQARAEAYHLCDQRRADEDLIKANAITDDSPANDRFLSAGDPNWRLK